MLTAGVRRIKSLKWGVVPATCELDQKELASEFSSGLFSIGDADPNFYKHWRNSSWNLTLAAQEPYIPKQEGERTTEEIAGIS